MTAALAWRSGVLRCERYIPEEAPEALAEDLLVVLDGWESSEVEKSRVPRFAR